MAYALPANSVCTLVSKTANTSKDKIPGISQVGDLCSLKYDQKAKQPNISKNAADTKMMMSLISKINNI